MNFKFDFTGIFDWNNLIVYGFFISNFLLICKSPFLYNIVLNNRNNYAYLLLIHKNIF